MIYSNLIFYSYRFLISCLDTFLYHLWNLPLEHTQMCIDELVQEFETDNNTHCLFDSIVKSEEFNNSRSAEYLAYKIALIASKSSEDILYFISLIKISNSQTLILSIIYSAILSYKFIMHDYSIHADEKLFIKILSNQLVDIPVDNAVVHLWVDTIIKTISIYSACVMYSNDISRLPISKEVPYMNIAEINGTLCTSSKHYLIFLQNIYISLCFEKSCKKKNKYKDLFIKIIYKIF
ncbi:hypothetical protein HZS_6943, partial [Henneguya salminicola]